MNNKDIDQSINSCINIIIDYSMSPFTLVSGYPEGTMNLIKEGYKKNMREYIEKLKTACIQYEKIKMREKQVAY